MQRKIWSGEYTVNNKKYGGVNPTYIIAEIGSNHGGDFQRAVELIRACADTGVDAVKFQSWEAAQLHNTKDVTESGNLVDSAVIPILKDLELPEEWHIQLAKVCQKIGIDFISTPFSLQRAQLLKSVGVPAIKIASGDLTYDELLYEVKNYNLPIFLSTGMANLGEIEHALNCLRDNANPEIVLLQCVGAYPPELADANLLAVRTIRETFNVPVGISDHYPKHDTILAAVAMGASLIEKHVTFSRNDGTPDSFYALEIDEFKGMVDAVRQLESSMGNGTKICMPSEEGGKIGGRRCIYAAKDLTVGDILTRSDVAIVRPNIGPLQPKDLSDVIGRQVKEPISQGMPLHWEYFSL